ncbi:MAG TPA: peptide chain release factor N(5)-glutamine methyltransferase [Xanthomonadaceae bacterium]|nr:peptide chain release factor N(5)-glutamine methyltransferase [Xanthomonadaceae bacterium]
MSVSRLLRDGAARLSGPQARFEAEWLLLHALGRDRAWLFAHPDAEPAAEDRLRFLDLIERRAAGTPVAYLIGCRGFWTLDLLVTPAVLIPRAETELLVEAALDRLRQVRSPAVLDLGTGSGAVALALAAERPDAQVAATDASAEALAVAAENARRQALGNVEFVEGNWYAPLGGRRFHLIVSNPPYIEEDDPHLDRGDLPHEPRHALVSGRDGLDAIRVIAAGASAHLHPGGWLLVEHGCDQGAAVHGLFAEAGLQALQTLPDLEERDRVTMGQWMI